MPRDVDAIAVPTSRPAEFVASAVDLARALRVPLVILCSGRSKAHTVRDILGSTPGAAITLASTPNVPLLDLHTARWHEPLVGPYLDTGNKRNAALLIGRLLGWRQLLFLDDDVRDLSASAVRVAAGGMAATGLRAVGWRFTDYPDNSVVCHARRSAGLDQGVFIGAGALLVGLSGWLPFFPSIYNEDWLFWHSFLAQGQVGQAGTVAQVPYEPFADPLRARQEEFGDVLAEGLVSLVHAGRTSLVAQLPGYWTSVIAERAAMLAELSTRLASMGALAELRSIEASQQRLGEITAEALGEFVSLWYRDLYRWNVRLNWLPRLTSLTDALAWLGLRDAYINP